jgi:4-hydroxy-tetrahydrodipicolinate synthase
MEAETVVRLSEVPNIIGVKEASGDLAQIKAIIDGVGRSDFRVWSGNDGDTYAMMKLGAHGVVAVASHLAGRQIKEMLDLCVAGDFAAAKSIHERLSPLFEGLFIVSNPIPVKYALNQIGFPVGGYRLPLSEPDDASAERIMAAVRACTVDLPLPAPR